MATIDWVVVAAFMALNVGIGLWFARRSSKSMADYFVAGRTIPWWLAGTSMLATSFASDTPLHTTRAIREGGLSAAWFYWAGILSGLVVAFIFARMWRRAGVVTDNEFIELRYSGRPAAVLRGGMAVFKTFVLEILTIAWITLGMVKIVSSILSLPETTVLLGVAVPTDIVIVAVLLVITVVFSMATGFWGVVATDILEFGVAMIGAVVLAFVAMAKVGWVDGLREGLKVHSPMKEKALDVFPSFDGEGITFFALAVYLGVQWWANANIDGSGQRAQRFLSCKDDRNAIAAGVWNMAVQWLIRSWPWYLTALASIVLYPTLADSETAYPLMVRDLLPAGLRGLMVASFFAAFMSTIEAHYNLTASYATNDLYRRFIVKKAEEGHYVRASRWLTLLIALIAAIVTLLLPSVLGAFRFKMELMAGLGLIYVLRWVWWRINAPAEIAALVVSVGTAFTLNALPATAGGGSHGAAVRLVLVVTISSAAALLVAFLTRPEPTEHLLAFYQRVRPPQAFWGPIARQAGALDQVSDFGWSTVLQFAMAMAFILSGMLGLGKLLLGEPSLGVLLLAVAVITGYFVIRSLRAPDATLSPQPATQPPPSAGAGV